MLHAVVMAGGSGTRFWPESRRNRPKQLLPVTGGRPMLAETLERLGDVVAPSERWVVTNARQVQGVRRTCPSLPATQILVEPVGRNTAACAGLAACVLRERDPDAVMAMLPADHSIRPDAEFQRSLRAGAEAAAERGTFVTFGIPPTHPATGYGYVRRGERVASPEGIDCFRVRSFTEKPDEERARAFLAEGDYLWNSGIFLWRADTILDAIAEHMPDLARGLGRIAGAVETDAFQDVVDEVYPGLPSQPVDVGIMEKVDGVLVLSAPYEWNDVGSWQALYELADKDANGNAAVFPAGGSLLAEDARGVLAYSSSPQLIAALGVEDLVIVRTADAVLVARRDRAEDVKRLVEALEGQGRRDLL